MQHHTDVTLSGEKHACAPAYAHVRVGLVQRHRPGPYKVGQNSVAFLESTN